MLHTILFLLKIIGIILLTIILIILLLAFLIAFVPIRYRIVGKNTEPNIDNHTDTHKDKNMHKDTHKDTDTVNLSDTHQDTQIQTPEEPSATIHSWNIRLTWMNPIVRFFLSYKGNNLDYKLKICGISISLDKEASEAKKQKKKLKKEKKPAKQKSEKIKNLVQEDKSAIRNKHVELNKNIATDQKLEKLNEKIKIKVQEKTKEVYKEASVQKVAENKILVETVKKENVIQSESESTKNIIQSESESTITVIHSESESTKTVIHSESERTKTEAHNESENKTENFESESENSTESDHKESRFRNIINKIKSFFIRVYEFVTGIGKSIRNLKYTITNLYDKIKSWNKKKNYYLEVLRDEGTKRALTNIKKQALVLLKHINPKKARIFLKFGTGNPENDGMLLGLISMFYPIFGNSLQVETDFNNEVLVYDVYMRGKIQIIVLIKIAWKLYFDKDLKELLKKINFKEEA